ncbi:hypothetical protein DXU07_14720 [Bradyrhizobium elkanii]|nr:hypothetical protein BLN97_31225 [Bradyrhizobium elkanii]
MFDIESRTIRVVVLAKARTHYPNCRLLRDAEARSPFHDQVRWLWVLAFARTTWREFGLACATGRQPG